MRQRPKRSSSSCAARAVVTTTRSTAVKQSSFGLNVEIPSQGLYELLKSWMITVRDELELTVPFEPNAVLGKNTNALYKCVRCLIESTASAGQVFVSEGELTRVQVNTPMLGQQYSINDTRLFEGWRTR